MKQAMVVMVVALVLLGSAPICQAEHWVLFNKARGTERFYDADSIAYYRDAVGPTPFPCVRIKEVVEFNDGPHVEIWLEVVRDFDRISPSWWRVGEALKQWQKAHPPRR